jgi:hypothetical protein
MQDGQTESTVSRRRVLRTGGALAGLGVLGVSASGSAAASGKPDFSPRLWGDGDQWGTKVTGVISNPNEHSLDKLFVVRPPSGGSLPAGQLPVSDAAPGNPDYNGGRWWTHVAQWTEAGLQAHGPEMPLLTRYGPADDFESIALHEALGHIEITEGSPGGPMAPPDYFRCPLLPVKD